MNMMFNTAQKLIVITDLTGRFDLNLMHSEFDKLTWRNNTNNLISNEMNFFDKDLFIDSKHIITEECEMFLKNTLQMEGMFDKLQMTNSWGNITKAGQMHHEHVHPFSVVSGVIYLDDNPGNLDLNVEGFSPTVPYFFSIQKSYVSLNSLFGNNGINPADVQHLKNHLILFLSNSHHFVSPMPEDAPDRRSIAFNTFWRGYTGIKNEPLGSHTF